MQRVEVFGRSCKGCGMAGARQAKLDAAAHCAVAAYRGFCHAFSAMCALEWQQGCRRNTGGFRTASATRAHVALPTSSAGKRTKGRSEAIGNRRLLRRRDMPKNVRSLTTTQLGMTSPLGATLLVLSLLPLASASNSTDDGLSGGAIAGIIIGSLAGVILIGAIVWYFFFREMPAQASGAATSVSIDANAQENTLPMVALRVSGHDDDL